MNKTCPHATQNDAEADRIHGAICYAIGCVCEINARDLMCQHHWELVPLKIQQVLTSEVFSRSVDEPRSDEFWAAAQMAVDAVESAENQQQQEAK
ncbi:MAG: hypothetical protein JWR69_3041 [Pedosphaera sp.]|nr:hypothetical protein [Pedosphaera sp.]